VDTYGFPVDVWEDAKREAHQAMVTAARQETTISYSDLVKQIQAIQFEPHDFNLFHLLGQISTREVEEGRGMLTAVVVTQDDGLPGQGYFHLASHLGLDASDPDAFWVSELRKVYSSWRESKAR